MAMKRCPVCGEKYSHTAGECPFCKEDARWKSEEKPAENCGGKRPAKPSKQFSALVSTLMLSIVIVSASLIYLLREGVQWADNSVKKPLETLPHQTEQQAPQTEREPQRISAEPEEQPGDGDSGNGSGAASELKAGFAEVVNAETGVRVRSGPGTDYKALISIYNGVKIRVVKSVDEDWYEIIFYNARGVETTGYMKGEFLKAN